jgi:predicted nucleic acid-binding protein
VQSVDDALSGVTRLGLDTAPFIYFTEANPTYVAVCRSVFRAIVEGRIIGITSTLSLTETLAHPIRTGNVTVEAAYRTILLATPMISTLPPTSDVAILAARLRAKHGLKTPDALQVATAITAGCEAFLTGDKGLRRVTELPVLVLDYLTP